MNNPDLYVTLMIIAIIVVWLFYLFKKWLYKESISKTPPYLDKPTAPKGEVVSILKEHGYEPIAGKYRIPLYIKLNDVPLESRLFIDLFAKHQNDVYIVKLERERLPIKWTGSKVRDQYLVYALLYDNIRGVLVVNINDRKINKIIFELGDK